METNQVFKAIETERAYQEQRWTNPQSSVAEYILYMQHHLNKAAAAISSSEAVEVHNSVMAQIRKVTALGVACGEQHGMPVRPGFGDAYLFVSGDVIISEGVLYQCICSDAKQAVLARAILTPEGLLTPYENLFVTFNFENSDFTFQRVSLDDIARGIQFITENYSC